jgi:8-oxo-dGTP pyrophosphatase MutT (NUDIX family)
VVKNIEIVVVSKNMNFIDPKTYYQNLPKKRMAVAALFFNEQGQILILKTSYKKYWTLPGGVVEQDESLSLALLREIKEEIGLDIINYKLAVLDYCFPKLVKGTLNTESIQVLFDCGIIDKKSISLIKIDNDEIIEYQFCEIMEALEILGIPLRKRLRSYLKTRETVYLENGLKK